MQCLYEKLLFIAKITILFITMSKSTIQNNSEVIEANRELAC